MWLPSWGHGLGVVCSGVAPSEGHFLSHREFSVNGCLLPRGRGGHHQTVKQAKVQGCLRSPPLSPQPAQHHLCVVVPGNVGVT